MDIPAGDEGTVSMRLPKINSSFRLMVEGVSSKGLTTDCYKVLVLLNSTYKKFLKNLLIFTSNKLNILVF